jgi:predicted outer membrane repeat protein
MNWLRNLFARTPQPAPRPRPPLRPRLEALEDRCVPTVWSVTSSADDVTQAGTLRWAVAQAHDGDTIDILPVLGRSGLVARHIKLTHGELYLNHNVTIESVWPERAWIDGNYSSRVFEIARGVSVEFDNLVLVHGNAKANNSQGNASLDGDGGAILNEGSLTIDRCSVSDNGYTSFGTKSPGMKAGGGIYNYHGNVFVTNDSTVNHNFAGAGGGIYNDRGTLLMVGTTLDTNSANGNGGAILEYFGQAEINHCVLDGNAALRGGALANFGGDVKLESTDVEQNTGALVGGALFNQSGWMWVNSGSTLKDNFAVQGGGGIYNLGGDVAVTSSSLVHNTTAGDGGGIYSYHGEVDVLGSHLDKNTAGHSGGAIAARYTKTTVTDSELSFNIAEDNGGAIFGFHGSLTVSDSQLIGNWAWGLGGGIYTDHDAAVVTGSKLLANLAQDGAAIYNAGSTLKIGTTLFELNIPNSWIAGAGYTDLGGNTFI